MGEVPLTLAFSAGLLASVNPCGFAMLPAFVSFYVGTRAEEGSGRGRVTDGIFVGAVLSAGFMLVFGVFGTVFSLGARAAIRYVPWLAIVVGVALIAVGVWLLAGRYINVRLPGLPNATPRDGGWRSMLYFGIAYAIGSLSCTLPVFLVVIGGGLAAGSVVGTLVTFLTYGLGMATILMLLALGTASFRELLVRRIRRVLPYVSRISGGLLVAGGAYVIYYWGSILAGSEQRGPTVWVSRAQRWAQDVVVGVGEEVWFAISAVLVAAALWVWLRPKRPEAVSDATREAPEAEVVEQITARWDR